MAYINWNDSFSVKIPSIDEQHKKLIGLINEFYEGITKNYSVDKLVTLVDGLIDYTGYHFKHEESLMDKFGYAETADHKKIHNDFVQKVIGFKERLEQGKLITTVEVTNYIKDWIADHIQKTDMAYSTFFIDNGVK